MKRLFTLLTAAFITLATFALDYEYARREAWFLTDKMAYELNLTPQQYNRAYEINLDYLLSVNNASQCYGHYWSYRNADLRCILYDWQYSLYTTLDYFFRPIRWVHGWYFPILNHYRQGYYYFDRPHVYADYRGRNWRRRGHNDISPYHGFKPRPGNGMRDHYRGGHDNGRPGGSNHFNPPHRPGTPGVGSPGGSNRPQRPGVGSNNRPGNNNRPGVGSNQRPGNNNNNRPGVGGNQRPGNNDNNRPGVGSSQRPSNNNRPGVGSSQRPSSNQRPGVGSSNSRPQRPNVGSSRGSSRSTKGTSNKTSRQGRSFGR